MAGPSEDFGVFDQQPDVVNVNQRVVRLRLVLASRAVPDARRNVRQRRVQALQMVAQIAFVAQEHSVLPVPEPADLAERRILELARGFLRRLDRHLTDDLAVVVLLHEDQVERLPVDRARVHVFRPLLDAVGAETVVARLGRADLLILERVQADRALFRLAVARVRRPAVLHSVAFIYITIRLIIAAVVRRAFVARHHFRNTLLVWNYVRARAIGIAAVLENINDYLRIRYHTQCL